MKKDMENVENKQIEVKKKRQLTKCQLVEQSIIKTYRKTIWNPFIKACQNYELIKEGDKIAVCISGGKDSMLLAKLMQELKKHIEVNFSLEFIVMDPGYKKENRERIEENAKILEVPIHIFESDIFDVTAKEENNPCYLCARMRRGFLYKKAQELGCNKIALGHHFNDVIETTLLGMFYGSQLQGMMPKLHSLNFPGMELIRPMYCVKEKAIINWMNANELTFIQCACRLTEEIAKFTDGVGSSKRQEVKKLIRELKKTNPEIEDHIFCSLHSVNIDTFCGYKENGVLHSFLEFYDSKKGNE